jgi:hypothetical protein
MSDPVLQLISMGFAIADILAVVVTTSTASYLMKTASEAGCKCAISQGQEKELRKINTILALIRTKDLIKGYDITFKDVLLHPELLAITNGGVVTMNAGVFQSYEAPVAGQPVEKELFSLDIYCGDKDTDGTDKQYLKFSLPGCEGSPTDFDFKDGEFFSPQFTIKNRPTNGVAPMGFSVVTTLPAIVPPPEG